MSGRSFNRKNLVRNVLAGMPVETLIVRVKTPLRSGILSIAWCNNLPSSARSKISDGHCSPESETSVTNTLPSSLHLGVSMLPTINPWLAATPS